MWCSFLQEGGDDELVKFETQEPLLAHFAGEQVQLSFTVRAARGLPKKLTQDTFVSFKFFLEKMPLSTATCGARTTNPKWEQTISLFQIVNDDLLQYISNSALEIEVKNWLTVFQRSRVLSGSQGLLF